MAANASHALGAAEVAGSFVNPKGMTKKMTASVAGRVAGGVVGSVAASMKTGSPYAGAADVPNFGRVGYIAVTADDIALVKTETGMLKMKIGDKFRTRIDESIRVHEKLLLVFNASLHPQLLGGKRSRNGV